MRPAEATYDEAAAADVGLRFVVKRGPHSLCAYVGVPADHPLAECNGDVLPITCHGGVTFSGEFVDLPGWYWWGWDYAHLGDHAFYEDELSLRSRDGVRWDVLAVREDSVDTRRQFRQLLDVVEYAVDRVEARR